VDEYISAQPETAQVVLQLVRSTLRKVLPGAEEVISYKIPAYRLHGGIVLYFAGWKQRYSLYPAGERMVAAFESIGKSKFCVRRERGISVGLAGIQARD